MLNYEKLPNIMYFGTSKKIEILKDKVFLTPYIGIASLFIINDNDIFPKGYKTKCNLTYKQWNYPNELLKYPQKTVNINHNIPLFKNEIYKGTANGFIYKINIEDIKDKLSLFVTNNPDREVIYNGENPLKIIEIIPHTLEWDFSFNEINVQKYGMGTAEKV